MREAGGTQRSGGPLVPGRAQSGETSCWGAARAACEGQWLLPGQRGSMKLRWRVQHELQAMDSCHCREVEGGSTMGRWGTGRTLAPARLEIGREVQRDQMLGVATEVEVLSYSQGRRFAFEKGHMVQIVHWGLKIILSCCLWGLELNILCGLLL